MFLSLPLQMMLGNILRKSFKLFLIVIQLQKKLSK